MRIVTRPDFDGIVCAVLLYEAEDITESVKWTEPSDMQKGLVNIRSGDIIANLPYHDHCTLWFDHHYTNRIDKPFKGAFEIAPSAAGVIYEYYKDRFERDYSELIRQTDKIDAANLTLDEVLYPENYDYVLLSMTLISCNRSEDEPYWNKLVGLLRHDDIALTMDDPEVKLRCKHTVENNGAYREYLKKHTQLVRHVAVTDFRSYDKAPVGNRFLVYSMFPEAIVHVKIRYDDTDKDKMIINVGHSIFNPNCNVNVGRMLSKFEGGGHPGAGAAKFDARHAERYLSEIIEILVRNEDSVLIN